MKYVIPKGWHFALPPIPKLYKSDYLKWKVKFTNSCKYSIGQDQADWNKLVGVSNHLNPKIDSVRFVWRYLIDDDVFEIAVYKEVSNIFFARPLTTVKAGETLNLEMTFHKSLNNIYVAANHSSTYIVFCPKKWLIGCHPYFGGNIPAPHTISLSVY